ncbi:MATE efflux family protein [Hymenopellis radicata]|nr:MATE efflux family protein [Hymenopellis radicata]
MSHQVSPTESDPLIWPALTSPGVDVAGYNATSSSNVERGGKIEQADRVNFRLFGSLAVDSAPVILSYILQNSIQTVSILIVGRLGQEELSVAAFSLMLAFSVGWCVALGGTTALDTFGSQAFTGGSRPTDLSIHFQRCILLLWLLLIPVCVFWAFIEPVLLALGQPELLSRDVQRFLRVLIIGAPGYIGFESLKKYLQCQGIMSASTAVLAILFPINIGLNIVFVRGFGLLGSPLALSVTYWLSFVLLSVLTYISPTHRRNGCWGGIQLVEVVDFRSCVLFLKLAIPGILMVGTEWAAFEIVALAAGRLGSLPLAAQSVIMTTDQILNTLPFGIGVAASNRVGNLIGSRSALGAKHAAHASALLSVIVGTLVMIVMMATKDVYGYLFSDDKAVVDLVSKVMPLVASFQVADGLAGSCGGVLRGQGRQHLGAFFNLVAYYVWLYRWVSPSHFVQTLVCKGFGLAIGQVVALFIVGIGEYCVVWLATDWDLEVQLGIERNNVESKYRAAHAIEE